MSTPRIDSITPPYTITGGRITIHGSDFPVGARLPEVRVGSASRASCLHHRRNSACIVTTSESGALPVSVEGAGPRCDGILQVGTPVATGLHQVDNPVFDAAGNLYVTYSGTRGQQVPVSIFRVTPSGTREKLLVQRDQPHEHGSLARRRTLRVEPFRRRSVPACRRWQREVYAADLGIACGLAFAPDGTLFVGDRSGTFSRSRVAARHAPSRHCRRASPHFISRLAPTAST